MEPISRLPLLVEVEKLEVLVTLGDDAVMPSQEH